MKKVLVAIIFVIIVGAIGLLYYKTTTPNTTPTNTSTTNNFPNDTEQTPDKNFPASDLTTNTNNTNNLNPNASTISDTSLLFPQATTTLTEANLPKVPVQVSTKPVVSATTYGTARDVTLALRYMERGDGNIYEYKPLSASSVRLTNKTLPRVQALWWGNKGQTAIALMEDPDTYKLEPYSLRIEKASGTTSKLEGHYLTTTVNSVVSGPIGEESITCDPLLISNLNNKTTNKASEVKILQEFLLAQEGFASVRVTGTYDATTTLAVKNFQERYSKDILVPAGLNIGTGSVGSGTRAKINKLNCERVGTKVTGGRYAYVSTSPTGVTTIGTALFDKEEGGVPFTSSMSELQLAWPSKNSLLVTTSPSASTLGYAYRVDLSNISKNQMLENIVIPLISGKGLTINSNSTLSHIIYSTSLGSHLKTKILDVKSGESKDFPLVTLPREKCVWSSKNNDIVYCASGAGKTPTNLPDSWYQGAVGHSDRLYKVDITTEQVSVIYDPATNGPDVKQIFLSEDESYIFYVDKSTGLLWALRLEDF